MDHKTWETISKEEVFQHVVHRLVYGKLDLKMLLSKGQLFTIHMDNISK